MSNDFNFGNSSPNPYASPTGFSHSPPPPNQPSTGKILAPGIALIVVGAIGLIASVFNVIFALVVEPQVDPNAPEFVRQMQAGAAGPMTAVIQAVCVFMNLFIIFGGVQMGRVSMWGVALGASIVAMVNFGTCCCVVGIPIGIWSIVILTQEDVRQLFKIRSQM